MAFYYRTLATTVCNEIANASGRYSVQWLRFFPGAIPNRPTTATTANMLAEIELPQPWANVNSSGYLSLRSTLSGTITRGGNCTWFQLAGKDAGTDRPILTGRVNVSGHPADIHLSNVIFYNGDPIKISAFTIYPLRLSSTD